MMNFLQISGIVAAFFACSAALAAPPVAALRVDARAPGIAVSPTLYGVFFEEINHSGDGGIYAELIRNRSFEDAPKTADAWAVVGGDGASVSLDSSSPINAANPRSLRLTINRIEDKRPVGVTNTGYWGIPVVKGKSYTLTLWARRDTPFGASGNLRVRLENANGTRVYAESALPSALTAEWKPYTLRLTARETDTDARFTILADHVGTVWLDSVSLFPVDTYKNRPNGLRPDLATLLADMKPSFLRFPGGCYVEGDTMQSAYRWKETIGDTSLRPGRPNLWGYRSTDGLGYHEYLQLCEDIGAEPLLVVNCGMSHHGNVPLAELDPWIQDTLDAVEYAVGPKTSRWGALRAKHGHPDPFRLNYIEVGNENGGDAYNARYALFYDALHKQHPGIHTIANQWQGNVPGNRPVSVLDEHYYSNADFFLKNANRYDSYSRTGPKIYVGEYAVTQGAGTGNLRAAVAEAAFMTGMERNSDVVTMASYAPLFVNTNDRKWNPDAIAFDSNKSFGTPSYWVQRLFAENRAETTLPLTVTVPEAVDAPHPERRGAVGIGTWRTAAEYRNITATDADGVKLLDVGGTAEKWNQASGAWSQSGGVYSQSDVSREDLRAVFGDSAWKGDYTLSLQARKTAGSEGFLVLFRSQDDKNYYWWNIGGWGNSRHAVERSQDGSKSVVSGEVPGSVETGRWYDIRVEVTGAKIRCYLDGKLIHDFKEKPMSPFHAVAGRGAKGRDLIVKAANAADSAQTTDVTLDGFAAGKEILVTETVLTGPSPESENSLVRPTLVSPVTRTFTIAKTTEKESSRFSYTFAPHSVTVLRLRAK